jgi:hypothetical protein
MDFSQYFFGAGTPVVAVAQRRNDAIEISRPNERFPLLVANFGMRPDSWSATSRNGDLKSPTKKTAIENRRSLKLPCSHRFGVENFLLLNRGESA